MARRFNITIDHATTANNSDRDSLSSEEEEEEEEEEERGGGGEEEEDSAGTGVQVSPRSAAGSQEYSSDPQEEPEGSWTKVYADDIGPSDSASRPRTSNHQRPLVEAPQPGEARRPSYRRIITQERVHNVPHPRAPRAPPSETESVESHEEWRGYPQGPPQHYARGYQYPPAGYPSPGVYQYAAPSVISPGQQQMVLRGYPGYQASPPPGAGYFGPQVISGHEMMPHAPHPAFYQYPQQSFPISMSPPPAMYAPYPVYTPPPATPAPIPTPAPAPAPAAAAEKADLPAKAATPPPPDTSKDDEKFARLEKLFLDEKADRDAREAAAKKALEDAEAKAKSDKERADEIKEATTKAAAKAKEDAKKEFQKAADKAAAEAKAAEPPPAPKEKDKPIKFKDAIGRRFNFPFHMCNTWTGMEYLIKEAFLHVENYGPHVAEGMYDLLGPHGEIIMKSVWETVVEPGWEISMHMWPIPEPPEIDLAAALDGIEIVDEGLPPPPPPAPSASGEKPKKGGKKKQPAGFSSLFGSRKPAKKSGKGKKK